MTWACNISNVKRNVHQKVWRSPKPEHGEYTTKLNRHEKILSQFLGGISWYCKKKWQQSNQKCSLRFSSSHTASVCLVQTVPNTAGRSPLTIMWSSLGCEQSVSSYPLMQIIGRKGLLFLSCNWKGIIIIKIIEANLHAEPGDNIYGLRCYANRLECSSMVH